MEAANGGVAGSEAACPKASGPMPSAMAKNRLFLFFMQSNRF